MLMHEKTWLIPIFIDQSLPMTPNELLGNDFVTDLLEHVIMFYLMGLGLQPWLFILSFAHDKNCCLITDKGITHKNIKTIQKSNQPSLFQRADCKISDQTPKKTYSLRRPFLCFTTNHFAQK